jgi:hypothetical protein
LPASAMSSAATSGRTPNRLSSLGARSPGRWRSVRLARGDLPPPGRRSRNSSCDRGQLAGLFGEPGTASRRVGASAPGSIRRPRRPVPAMADRTAPRPVVVPSGSAIADDMSGPRRDCQRLPAAGQPGTPQRHRRLDLSLRHGRSKSGSLGSLDDVGFRHYCRPRRQEAGRPPPPGGGASNAEQDGVVAGQLVPRPGTLAS